MRDCRVNESFMCDKNMCVSKGKLQNNDNKTSFSRTFFSIFKVSKLDLRSLIITIWLLHSSFNFLQLLCESSNYEKTHTINFA